MEIIIGNVLFRAFVKRTQNPSCNAKEKKTQISVLRNALPSEKCHNLPGTPVERLSLNTTVMLIPLILLKSDHCYCKLLLMLLKIEC